ncbi:MAG: NFACT family protein, partial [Clostridia bacterium]|nr:NFACT family protein [Clostridia bacterium]
NKSDLVKKVKNLIARNERKLVLRKQELLKSANREHLRIYGELIKANIYRIPKGATKLMAQNYYDPECKEIEIPLNSALSPANNASKYFKEYKKACTAEQTLGKLINDCEKELSYLESVLFELQSANSNAELLEIRAELGELGYIPRNLGNKKAKITASPYEFSKNGYRILVGRNNLQNDKLTTKIAEKNDLWFHTKNIHGAHVILFTEGKEPDDETLLFAATLAAYFSKAQSSNQVPVDYTPVRFVKKPNGAKPGMVIYQTNKTIFANPGDFKL